MVNWNRDKPRFKTPHLSSRLAQVIIVIRPQIDQHGSLSQPTSRLTSSPNLQPDNTMGAEGWGWMLSGHKRRGCEMLSPASWSPGTDHQWHFRPPPTPLSLIRRCSHHFFLTSGQIWAEALKDKSRAGRKIHLHKTGVWTRGRTWHSEPGHPNSVSSNFWSWIFLTLFGRDSQEEIGFISSHTHTYLKQNLYKIIPCKMPCVLMFYLYFILII